MQEGGFWEELMKEGKVVNTIKIHMKLSKNKCLISKGTKKHQMPMPSTFPRSHVSLSTDHVIATLIIFQIGSHADHLPPYPGSTVLTSFFTCTSSSTLGCRRTQPFKLDITTCSIKMGVSISISWQNNQNSIKLHCA